MKKIISFIFIFSSATLFSQAFRIEFGFSMLSYTQKGQLYEVDDRHVPSWYEITSVDRKLRSPGFTTNVFYPLNFGGRSYEKFSFGPQIGFGLNKSTLDFSSDDNYRTLPAKMNMRIPVMFSVRIGSLHAAYRHVLGLALASGIEMMQLQIADQTGTFYLPVIQTCFALGRFSFNVNTYPMSVESMYNLADEEVPRLTTKFIEFQVLVGIDCYPRRYHNDAPTKRKNRSHKR